MSLLRCLILLAAIGFGLEVRAADAMPTALDALLIAWSEASRNCRSLDAKLTVIYRDSALGDRTEEGRFYFEAPNQGRFHIGREFAIVWQANSSLHLMNERKQFTRLSANHIALLRRRETELWGRPLGWFGKFYLVKLQEATLQPEEAIPGLLLTDLDGFRERFDLQLGEIEGKPWLTAKPKLKDGRWSNQLQFIFNKSTHLPEAVKEFGESGHRVLILEETRLDETPSDRDQLLNPDLTGWKSQPFADAN